MPFKVIIAADHHGLIQAVNAILRLLSLSCVVTMTTTLTEAVREHLVEQEPHLMILGFSRKHAQSVIRHAREARPGMRVLWVSEASDPLPEADATLSQPVTALRLVEAVSRAMK